MIMQVDRLDGSSAGRLSNMPTAAPVGKSNHRTGLATEPDYAMPAVPDEIDVRDSDGDEGEVKERGVIRLLEAGHFKGVADVRLRINFFDELAAKAGVAGAHVATAGTGELVANVSGQARELLAGWELDEESQEAAEEALAQFELAAHTSLEGVTNGGKLDSRNLAEALQSVFDAFKAQLATLMPPAAPEIPPPDDGDDPAETELLNPDEAAETPSPASGLDLLAQYFDEQLADLLTSVGDASQLPPLSSEPTGNGKAYAKFLAMYNELAGQSSGISPPIEAGEEQVDLIV
jgi:hypothetical protein